MESRVEKVSLARGVHFAVVLCAWLVAGPVLAQTPEGQVPWPYRAPDAALPSAQESSPELSSSAASTLLYVHGPTLVFTMDLATRAAADLGAAGVTLTDVALAPNGILYGSSFAGLYRIDTTTGATTRLPGSYPVLINALVWSPDGSLLAAGSRTLLRINPTTCAATVIGQFGIPYDSAGDLEFGADGALYLTATGPTATTALLKVNPHTGAATVVGDIGFAGVFGLVRDAEGRMWGGTDSGTLLEINTATGQGTAVFSSRRAIWGMSGHPQVRPTDTTPPVITTPGDLTLECTGAAPPIASQVSAVDAEDGPVSVTCTPGGAYPRGTTLTTCSASDAAGNVATAQFSVTMLATGAPTLSLLGDSVMELECGVDTYVDPGATAQDSCSSPLVVHKYNSGQDAYGPGPNTAAEGTYSVQYIAWDATGYTVSALRSVKVKDNRPPTLQLRGPSHMMHTCGRGWVDPGVEAVDACYGNVAPTVRTTGFVNGWVPGTYTVRYEVTDSGGNSAPPVTRTVQVVNCPW
ncbi:immunoglobulin-like domain-containing protein [Hyalangium rubrum]|uniref:DUF5011 domain-containing protein n=1 Tax=Hyalangium rubrum TaxID=3103134 RepID=A0ABU5H7Q0_9BACT|nr:immunoglobulin-like domain-containing protein [Hyalangium sp. s54d21]MDY7228914.1 DUF5011 domain-containing protein [Hyalangium sp. s54d21]